MWLPDTQMLLTYRMVGSVLIFQYLYMNYILGCAQIKYSGVVGSGWGMGVTVRVPCVMYCIYPWSYGLVGQRDITFFQHTLNN